MQTQGGRREIPAAAS